MRKYLCRVGCVIPNRAARSWLWKSGPSAACPSPRMPEPLCNRMSLSVQLRVWCSCGPCAYCCSARVRPCARGRCGRCPLGFGVTPDFFLFCCCCSYKRVKGRSHTVEKGKAIHPQKPHATFCCCCCCGRLLHASYINIYIR